MNYLKIALCVSIVAAVLFFTGCSNPDNGGDGDSPTTTNATNTGGSAATVANRATGRYVQQEITPPINGWFTTAVSPEGNLVAFNQGFTQRFDSQDLGQTWVSTQGPGYGNNQFQEVQTVAYLPNGNLLVYFQGYGMTEVAPDGSTTHFPVADIDQNIADGDSHNVSVIQVLDNNQVLLSYSVDWMARMMNSGAIEMFTQADDDDDDDETDNEADENENDGENLQTIRVGGGGGGIRVGGNVANMATAFMGSFGEQTTAIHSLETGDLVETLSHEMPAIGASQVGAFYTLQGENILRHSPNGDVDVALAGGAFAFSAPDYTATQIQRAGESFVVTVSTFSLGAVMGQTNALYRYFWDENATVSPDRTITIWSLEENPLVRAAITEIWRQHPDAYITYEVALTGEGGVSASDAVRTLNTRLLSGSGPDIIILDGVPIDSYAGRGMLLDLAGLVDTSGVYSSLLAPYTHDGVMYVVPTQFSIPVLMGETAHLASFPDLNSFVDRIVTGNPAAAGGGGMGRMFGGIPEHERAEVGFNDLEELFDLMWQANGVGFISDNQLNSNVLRDFLEAMEAISTMYGLATPVEEAMMGGLFTAITAGVGGGGGMRAQILPGSLMNYMTQSTNVAAFSVSNLMFLQGAIAREGSDFIPFPGLVPGAWTPSTIVGVSADTAVQDFAVAFVNTMLSLQVQHINHGLGLPVTQEAIAAQIEQLNEILAHLNQEFNIDMDSLIGELTTPGIIETTLYQMIWQATERLCEGRISLDEAVQEVEQSIRNYLAERQ